mmetsp:Transcript_15345/g.31537  ORF Transcript_15345/g.31537 Transcript_15345/m.31537 type:complete len:168 (+) Transcript_15345:1-504(+)
MSARCCVVILTLGMCRALITIPYIIGKNTCAGSPIFCPRRPTSLHGVGSLDDLEIDDFDFDEDFNERDELDEAIRQRESWQRARRADSRSQGKGPIPGDDDDGGEDFGVDDDKPLFRFPWDKSADGGSGDDDKRQSEPPKRKKKYSGGQELTGFWLAIRDIYDAVFW